MYHANTAPFITKTLIQHFGTSNPSPRFIQTVATAFQEGSYEDTDSGITFGSGKYGCMAASIAAILLDREATSHVLDADPAAGMLKEPLVKVIGLMRSLDYKNAGYARTLDGLWQVGIEEKIGQLPYEQVRSMDDIC